MYYLQINTENFPRLPLEEFKWLLALIIITFAALTIIVFLAAYIKRSRSIKEEKKRRKLFERYENILANILYHENELTRKEALAYFSKNDLNNDFNRKILLHQIILLHRDLTGKDAERLRNVYLWAGFKEESLKKLRNSKWHIKAHGIRELAQMKVAEAYKEIMEFVSDKNSVLRVESQVALAKLIDFDALTFLDHTKYPLTRWEQINLFHVFTHMPREHIPDFAQWLNAKKDSIVIFAVKMIGYLNQEQGMQKLKPILDHKNPEVRKAVVESLVRLEAFQLANNLKEQYKKEKHREEHLRNELKEKGKKSEKQKIRYNTLDKIIAVRVAILESLGELGTEEDYQFLDNEIHDPVREVSLAAADAIARIEKTGKKHLEELLHSANEKETLIIKHALSKNNHIKSKRYVI